MTGKIGLTRFADEIGDAVLREASSALNDNRPPALSGAMALLRKNLEEA